MKVYGISKVVFMIYYSVLFWDDTLCLFAFRGGFVKYPWNTTKIMCIQNGLCYTTSEEHSWILVSHGVGPKRLKYEGLVALQWPWHWDLRNTHTLHTFFVTAVISRKITVLLVNLNAPLCFSWRANRGNWRSYRRTDRLRSRGRRTLCQYCSSNRWK